MTENPADKCMSKEEAKLLFLGRIRDPDERIAAIMHLGQCQVCKDTYDEVVRPY